MTLTLWHLPLSPSTRILWLLGEIGCPFDLVPLDEGGVPALRDGEVTIHEPGAMAEWLCETRGPDLWRAPGEAGRMGWLDWLHFGESLSRAFTAGEAVTGALHLLEDRLGEEEWLLSTFSGVDCHVGLTVWQVGRHGPLPAALRRYADRCAARPAFRAALDVTPPSP